MLTYTAMNSPLRTAWWCHVCSGNLCRHSPLTVEPSFSFLSGLFHFQSTVVKWYLKCLLEKNVYLALREWIVQHIPIKPVPHFFTEGQYFLLISYLSIQQWEDNLKSTTVMILWVPFSPTSASWFRDFDSPFGT